MFLKTGHRFNFLVRSGQTNCVMATKKHFLNLLLTTIWAGRRNKFTQLRWSEAKILEVMVLQKNFKTDKVSPENSKVSLLLRITDETFILAICYVTHSLTFTSLLKLIHIKSHQYHHSTHHKWIHTTCSCPKITFGDSLKQDKLLVL